MFIVNELNRAYLAFLKVVFVDILLDFTSVVFVGLALDFTESTHESQSFPSFRVHAGRHDTTK